MSHPIDIQVKAQYIEEQSRPEESKHVFAYTIRIENQGDKTAQLLSRYWHITDAESRVQEVQGEGVVGEQPTLKPGESYSYTSGVIIQTPPGTMEGHYQFKTDEGEDFLAPIPLFALVPPESLH